MGRAHRSRCGQAASCAHLLKLAAARAHRRPLALRPPRAVRAWREGRGVQPGSVRGGACGPAGVRGGYRECPGQLPAVAPIHSQAPLTPGWYPTGSRPRHSRAITGTHWPLSSPNTRCIEGGGVRGAWEHLLPGSRMLVRCRAALHSAMLALPRRSPAPAHPVCVRRWGACAQGGTGTVWGAAPRRAHR